MPNGVIAMNTELNMPETSNNVGVVRTTENTVEVVCAVRSSVMTKKQNICDIIDSISSLCGGKTLYRGDYPAWEYNPNSALKDVCIKCYKKQYGVEPAVETVHAGLECGLFAEKVPDMDMVSFGPNLYDIHTPKEKASISSIERVWNFVLNVLAELK
jgi:dipeptidase D